MPTEELILGDRKIILVGTAHVSSESVNAVEDAITKYKPDAVAVELCRQRYQALIDEKKWEETEITKVISSGKMYLFLLQILLANFQRKIGEDVGVKPGAEMLKAVEIAKREGMKVVLADRDIGATLKRAMDQMTYMEKAKLLWAFMSGFIEGEKIDKELIERLKERDVLTELMEELAVETPSIKKVLVDERDEYIANMIHTSEGNTMVAVVGAGHMEGIKRNLLELDGKILVRHLHQVEGVNVTSESKGGIGLVGWTLPAAFILLLGWVFVRYGGQMTWDLALKIFLLQGSGAALGVAIAFGHPLSILAAFLTAPIAFLHPAIAVGWIAGYVELKMRKPRVVDFKNLIYLKSLRDYWGNRVVRVILIVAFANMGSMLGSLIGFVYFGLARLGQ